MNLWMILERAAQLYPNTIAVVDGDQRLTYGEVRERAARLARFFAEQGIAKGDRLAILDHNSFEYLETYYAAAGLGAILCPLNHRLALPELLVIIADSGARYLVARPEHAAVAQGLLAARATLEGVLWLPGDQLAVGVRYDEALAVDPDGFVAATVQGDHPAHLYYTSGTTGRPKGVVLTHRNVFTHALATLAELGISDTDVWAHVAPMFHLADAWATFAITMAGGRHVMVPRFEAASVLAAFEQHSITLTNLIPTMLNLMVKHEAAARHDYSSLRLILSGGAPIAPEVVRRIIEVFGCEYVQTYGMTETSPYLTLSVLKAHLKCLPAAEQLAYKAKTGRPFIAVELKVVRADGSNVAADGQEVGEIWVRGDTVTPGYWNRPQETAAAFSDGWLKTSDLAVLDDEGYVNIVDRAKDMILTGGENVYSTEVEHALYEHAAVLEAAAFGLPHPVWGEAVTAAVVLREGYAATADELTAFCKLRLAGYKVPKQIFFVAELPKTGTGKISKKLLREGCGKREPA